MVMSFFGDDKQWKCGKGGSVNLQRVSSIVRDIGEPCLHQPEIKVVIPGVDPSISAEVWEFLLGCYALSSTTEYRRQLRTARRERYQDLVRQCQMMHSSVGTGSLAYVVGSKVMDMRASSKGIRDAEVQIERISETVQTKKTVMVFWIADLDINCIHVAKKAQVILVTL